MLNTFQTYWISQHIFSSQQIDFRVLPLHTIKDINTSDPNLHLVQFAYKLNIIKCILIKACTFNDDPQKLHKIK